MTQSFSSTKKIFPLRLPRDFHGQTPPRINNFKYSRRQPISKSSRQNSETNSVSGKIPSLSAWKKPRPDSETAALNRFYIQHTSRSSHDNPEEFKNTLGYYHKQNYTYPSKSKYTYTVFGQQKPVIDYNINKFNLSSSKFYDSRPITLAWATGSNFRDSSKFTFESQMSNNPRYLKKKQYKIAEKVGGCRNGYIQKLPTSIKIGHNSYVDTYHVK